MLPLVIVNGLIDSYNPCAIGVLFIGLFQLKDYYFPLVKIPIISPILSTCRMITWNKELTILSAVVLGVLIGFCEVSCFGGIYLATVAMLSLKETFWQGALYLFIYNLMFISPLVIIFLFATNKTLLNKVKGWQSKYAGRAKLISGFLMTILGIILLIW